jgi:hypothetical protein
MFQTYVTIARGCCTDTSLQILVNIIQPYLYTLKPACNWTARDGNCLLCMQVPFHTGTWSMDPRNWKKLSLKTVLPYARFIQVLEVWILGSVKSVLLRQFSLMPKFRLRQVSLCRNHKCVPYFCILLMHSAVMFTGINCYNNWNPVFTAIVLKCKLLGYIS